MTYSKAFTTRIKMMALLFTTITLVSGCANNVAKPVSYNFYKDNQLIDRESNEEYKQTRYQCRKEALAAYPVQTVKIGMRFDDANSTRRAGLMTECMNVHGYTRKAVY